MKLLKLSIKIALSLLLLTYLTVTNAFEAHFFIVGHQDDWQLFMNPTVYESVKGTDKLAKRIIFIHVTAGDNGLGTTGTPVAYYSAREEGALRAIRFLVNTDNGARGLHKMSIATFKGHRLARYVYLNTVTYFLRLPGGISNGDAFPNSKGESLKNLYNGATTQIHAIDGSAVYYGWNDLASTLSALVEYESLQPSTITFNLNDSNTALNPNDHADHLYSTLLMQQIASAKPCVNQNLFLGYASVGKPVNVTGDNFAIDVGTWAVTTSGLSDNYHQSNWSADHMKWLGKNYFRTLKGTGVCG